MASESVQPLRIAKGAHSSAAKATPGPPRALSEISPSENRRNSLNLTQTTPTKKPAEVTNDSSPFQPSPLESTASPRLFWQNRNAENLTISGHSVSPTQISRRSSIERLQRASRVRNSNILALEQKQEYDPTRLPQIERPLAKVQRNAFTSPSSSGGLPSFDSRNQLSEKSASLTMSPSKTITRPAPSAHMSPVASFKEIASPTKSSLSPSKLKKGSFDAEASPWLNSSSILDDCQLPEGRHLSRHPKSVTFDAAPPQVNEYETATPDLSSVGTNSREGSYESIGDDEDMLYESDLMGVHDDSFDESLEDTEKTPVVGPDDFQDPAPVFHIGTAEGLLEDESEADGILSMAASGGPLAHKRSGSTNSNSDHRPLPPLPGLGHSRSQSSDSVPASPGLSATAERMLGSHRSLPVPPPASATKSDIQSFGNGKMSLEERLKLMMQSDEKDFKSAAEQQRDRRLRRGASRDRGATPMSESSPVDAPEYEEELDTVGDMSLLETYALPSRISRESILRRVDGNQRLESKPDNHYPSSPAAEAAVMKDPEQDLEQSPQRAAILDPDVPLPSTEEEVMVDEAYEQEGSVVITRGAADCEDDVLDMYQDHHYDNFDGELDDQSQYSEAGPARPKLQGDGEDGEANTPRASPSAQSPRRDEGVTNATFEVPTAALADLAEAEESSEASTGSGTETQTADVESGSGSIGTQRPQTPERRLSKPEYDGSGWGGDSDGEYEDEPDTPDSVIRHAVPEDEDARESPSIPEQFATIKASGSKLKTRVSNTPSDLAAMREARRQVSLDVPAVPPIPDKHRSRIGLDLTADQNEGHGEFLERHPSFKDRSLTLDLDTGLSLDQDFERVIESQKRGYLMRQNTKLVTASDKDGDAAWKTRSATSSPIKQQRPESWTVEPWNGKIRQRSTRRRPGTSSGLPLTSSQESNGSYLGHAAEEDAPLDPTVMDGPERGRLFVKVMGVKELDLPLPKNEPTLFNVTLDNGVHCVTTAWLELARNTPIGQEFELIVPKDLEFQLTMNVKLEKPAPVQAPAAATKPTKHKSSAFSRVFASPKKRKELELRQKAEEERMARQQREAVLGRNRKTSPSAYELLSPLAASDGSFGRAYVCLREHESRCFGRPYMMEAICFNEWATEEEAFVSSVKSKRGNSTVVKRAPYKIGKLELQLLFVPRPKNAKEDDMPKSMNSCIRELRAAEERLSRSWEGHLSQQGGDCPYWRRRYFKLVGNKLTAYHEATRQPRATINLSNARRLIDDRQALTEKETTGQSGNRRVSSFAVDEEGYMFVEEGFRIRFNNGEVIDFYADTAEDKDSWMDVLSDVIGRCESDVGDEGSGNRMRGKWCEIVLKREEQLRRRAEGRRVHSRTRSAFP